MIGQPRQVPTAKNVTVVYDPRVARGIAGHIAGAINGAAVARKTSFLRDRMGQQVLKADLSVTDDPLIVRGSSSRPFDGEGITGARLAMTATEELIRTKGRFALATMCIGVGQGIALLLERV